LSDPVHHGLGAGKCHRSYSERCTWGTDMTATRRKRGPGRSSEGTQSSRPGRFRRGVPPASVRVLATRGSPTPCSPEEAIGLRRREGDQPLGEGLLREIAARQTTRVRTHTRKWRPIPLANYPGSRRYELSIPDGTSGIAGHTRTGGSEATNRVPNEGRPLSVRGQSSCAPPCPRCWLPQYLLDHAGGWRGPLGPIPSACSASTTTGHPSRRECLPGHHSDPASKAPMLEGKCLGALNPLGQCLYVS
jgi:hypothetical protein